MLELFLFRLCLSKTNSDYFLETPFGQLPILFIDDTPLPQSGAIVRFLANQLKLEPEGNLQNAFADMMLETMNEVLEKGRAPFMEKDETKKVDTYFCFFQCSAMALEKHGTRIESLYYALVKSFFAMIFSIFFLCYMFSSACA